MFAESVTDSSETEVLVKMEFLSDNEYGNSGRVEVLPPPARTLSDTENAQNASVTQYMAGILHPGGRNKLFPSCIQPSIRTNMEKPER